MLAAAAALAIVVRLKADGGLVPGSVAYFFHSFMTAFAAFTVTAQLQN